jgi:sec-independent protein translocase protein TatA
VFQVGPLELVVVLIIALIVLGPRRLPDAGNALGRGMREFRSALAGDHPAPDGGDAENHDESKPVAAEMVSPPDPAHPVTAMPKPPETAPTTDEEL